MLQIVWRCNETSKIVVKVDLKGDLAQKFRRIKEELGLVNNSEVVRALIKRYSKEEAAEG